MHVGVLVHCSDQHDLPLYHFRVLADLFRRKYAKDSGREVDSHVLAPILHQVCLCITVCYLRDERWLPLPLQPLVEGYLSLHVIEEGARDVRAALADIDGFGEEINLPIVALMRNMVISALKLKGTCATWFEKVDELHYFDEHR